MKGPCTHCYGVLDEWGAPMGATWVYDPPSDQVRKSPHFEPFKFCPDCGEQLIKDES